MGGSSLPVHWRSPDFDHPRGAPLDAALSTGFHMLERYGFHALEALQCQVERRAGGETGVRAVACLSGDEVWRAADAGRWPAEPRPTPPSGRRTPDPTGWSRGASATLTCSWSTTPTGCARRR